MIMGNLLTAGSLVLLTTRKKVMLDTDNNGQLNIQYYVLDILTGRMNADNINEILSRLDEVDSKLAFWMGLSSAITAMTIFMEDMDIKVVEYCARALSDIGRYLQKSGYADLGFQTVD